MEFYKSGMTLDLHIPYWSLWLIPAFLTVFLLYRYLDRTTCLFGHSWLADGPRDQSNDMLKLYFFPLAMFIPPGKRDWKCAKCGEKSRH